MSRLAVITTTWRRLHRLPATLLALQAQTFKDFSLYVWNNNADPGQQQLVDSVCSRCEGVDISAIHSYSNMSCRGRQLLARRLHIKHGYKYVVFFDDDLHIAPETLECLWEERQPTTIVSPVVWKPGGPAVWPKVDANPGEYGFYAQSCGAIVDASLFAYSQYWALWPQRYWGLDDIWMSSMANALGWRIMRASYLLTYDASALDPHARSEDQNYKTLWREFAAMQLNPQPGRFGIPLYERGLP